MQFVIYFIWILLLLLFNNADLLTGRDIVKHQDFKLPFPEKIATSSELCFNTCRKNQKSIITVETVTKKSSLVNVPTQENILATVYYKCASSNLQFDNDGLKRFRFHKFCDSVIENCSWSADDQNSQWSSLPNKGTPSLSVHLSVTEKTKLVRIRTHKCYKDRIVFDFKFGNKSIDYRQESASYSNENNVFTVMNLTKSPIVLSIQPIDSKVLVDIVFNITVVEIPTRNCSKVNEKYCNNICINNKIDSTAKCLIKVDEKDVEIENADTICLIKDVIDENMKKVGNGMCEYFRLNNIRPCEHICIDMPNCSFMCVQEYESQITEMGYQESVLLDHYGLVGSGHWSAVDIPDNLVFMDECSYDSKLCTNPVSCKDKPMGYECIHDDYNMMECILQSKNRFWHCPVNQSSYNNSTPSSIDSFVYSFYEIAKRKMDLEKKLSKMFSEVSSQYKAFKKWNASTRKNVSGYVIKEMEHTFQSFSVRTLNKNKPVFHQMTDSYDAYSSVVNETEEEHSIPIVESNSSNETQFVKFHIRDNDKFASDNKDLISNFIRYKDLDMMDESAEIDSQAKINGIFENSGFNVSEKDFVERYKNSDVIYLALNQNRNVTIKFKLKTSFKHTSPSWLYSFEDECGFLDKNGGWEWSVEGCSKKWISDKDYYCECDHLSNFAMLFSIKMVNEKHLTVFRYLSVIGATINIISLILFLIFVLLINSRDKLRLDQLNIAICLLLGTFVFLMGKYTSRNITLCKLTALSTQFLFLSAFIWKLILGINVVRMIASLRYQNEDWMVKYRLAAVAVGYGVPLTIVMFSGGFLWIYYGKISDEVCWIQSSSNAFLTFLIPIGIILAVNLMILFFIANTLIRNYIKTHKTKVNESNELLVFLQLVVAMGLTWLPSYLATIYLAAMYLWVIFFPLQGLMMFLFVVVINRENREKVSTFVLQRYSSLISKSTVSTDAKSQSKSKSSGEYKSTEQCQSLISQTDKENNVSNFPMVVVTDQDECRVPLQNSTC